MIKVKVNNGCTTYGMSWDSELSARELLIQHIHSLSDEEVLDMLESIVESFGEYNRLGYCEQCGDSYSETTLEIKDIND